jgi:hypothetical protein
LNGRTAGIFSKFLGQLPRSPSTRAATGSDRRWRAAGYIANQLQPQIAALHNSIDTVRRMGFVQRTIIAKDESFLEEDRKCGELVVAFPCSTKRRELARASRQR